MWQQHRGLWCDPPGVGGVSMSDQVGHAGHWSSAHRLELLCVLVNGQRSLFVLWHRAAVRHHPHHHRPHHVVGLRSAGELLHVAGSCSQVVVARYRLCTNIVCEFPDLDELTVKSTMILLYHLTVAIIINTYHKYFKTN